MIGLKSKILHLESVNASMASENTLLHIESKKASILVEQFQEKIDKANVDINKLKTENSKLYNVMEMLSPQRKFENQGKTFLQVGKHQQERKLQTLVTRAEQVLWFCKSFRLHVSSIKLIDEFGEDHCLSTGSKKGSRSYKDLPEKEKQDIQQVLFIMDKFCIGEAAYHELTCCAGGQELPRSYLVKQCKEDLNKLCSIERTPGEAIGAAFNFHDELSTVIENMVSFFWSIFCIVNQIHAQLLITGLGNRNPV